MTDKLLFALAFSDAGEAREAARSMGGVLFEGIRPGGGKAGLPFQSLVCGVGDDVASLQAAADVGLYLVSERIIKTRPPVAAHEQPGVVGIFPMVAHPALDHAGADAHWRDVHAPLALSAHALMTNYRQLNIVHRFNGPEWDGFALCGFDTVEDLRERFFVDDDYRRQVEADVRKFADVKRSPRRVIAREYWFDVPEAERQAL